MGKRADKTLLACGCRHEGKAGGCPTGCLLPTSAVSVFPEKARLSAFILESGTQQKQEWPDYPVSPELLVEPSREMTEETACRN